MRLGSGFGVELSQSVMRQNHVGRACVLLPLRLPILYSPWRRAGPKWGRSWSGRPAPQRSSSAAPRPCCAVPCRWGDGWGQWADRWSLWASRSPRRGYKRRPTISFIRSAPTPTPTPSHPGLDHHLSKLTDLLMSTAGCVVMGLREAAHRYLPRPSCSSCRCGVVVVLVVIGLGVLDRMDDAKTTNHPPNHPPNHPSK